MDTMSAKPSYRMMVDFLDSIIIEDGGKLTDKEIFSDESLGDMSDE